MERKLFFITFLAILLTNLLGMAIKVEKVKASGTIYIRADGSIDPSTANITSVDNVTYIFTGDNYDSIVVERNNIVVDGADYTLQGIGSGYGITLSIRSNVTLRNIEINAFDIGVLLSSSSNNIVSENTITNNTYGVKLDYSSSYNTVSGNYITNNNDGVYLSYPSNCNIISGNNITSNNWYGVRLYSSSNNNTISGNNITNNNWYGVGLYSSSNNTISRNYITSNGDGVFLESSSNYNTVSGNNITNNRYGVLLSSTSNYNTVSGNYITNNGYGVYLSSSSDNTISGNSFVDDGLFVYYSFGNVVVDNLVNGKPLVYLEDVSDLVVEDAGQVILVNCNHIRVENLNLSNTDVGTHLWNTHNTTITGNNITNNRYGVRLYYSSDNTFSGNNITNNYEMGIVLSDSMSNIVSENNIANNYAGVVFDLSSSNTVSGNNITNNWYDFWLSSSPSTIIYHNNFVADNLLILLIDSINNTWDNGCEGNFWSSFAGSDSGGDGIGDTPYIIDGSNQDNYPLMNPYWNPADINHDLKVDIFDVVLACVAYSSTPSDLNWNCHSDIAEPYSVIDTFDIVMIIESYGEEYTP